MGSRHHRGGRGPGWGPGWGPGSFGGPFPFGGPPFRAFGPPFWRGGKARRGDVRNAILAVLAEQPMNGYQVIQEIAERSEGMWRPSPGSVYPTLQQLEDEGLVTAQEREGRRLFELTEQGRAYVADHEAELAAAWASTSDAGPERQPELRQAIGQLLSAAGQVAVAGTAAQQVAAREILDDARRGLYRLLAAAEDDDAAGGEGT